MRATFRFDPADHDLTDDDLAKMSAALDASGLPHHVARRRIQVEGSWDDVMRVVRQCRAAVGGPGDDLVTTVVLDERPPVVMAGAKYRPEDRVPLADMDVQC